MKIKEIHVSNYCSFGHEAWISFSSNIMALIGRNGVGKTNALDAISRMKFFCDEVEHVIPARAVNQNTNESPVLKIYVTLDEQDISDIGPEIVGAEENRDVGYMFDYDKSTRRTRLSYIGLFFSAMQNIKELTHIRDDIEELGDYLAAKRILKDDNYQRLVWALKEYGRFYIPNISGLVSWALQNLIHHLEEPRKNKLKLLLEPLRDALEARYAAFRKVSPQIHLFEDAAEFPNAYNIDEVRAWDHRISRDKKVALERFLGAVGGSREELIAAFNEKNESVRNNIQDRIAKETRKLMREFNESYLKGSAEVELNVKFDGSYLRFTICNADTTGSVLWSEASSGVRWYLSTFFELKRALHARNSIILIDEPAIHLHVTAQKEALSLLQRLAHGTKYVLYTTHSPYLIDKNRLGDVNAIVRGSGVSIVRSLTDIEDIPSRMEVLTPVCHALGYDMSMSLVPQASRMNLVVEGISDACYINAMLKFLRVPDEDMPFVIPCQGAPSVPNVVSILFGWGLPFSVLLDRDEEGLKTSRKIDDAFGESGLGLHMCFVAREWGNQIENLLSSADYEKVCGKDFDPKDIKKSKVAKAKRFEAMVASGELIPDETTIKNFSRIFDWLEILDWEGALDDELEWSNTHNDSMNSRE